MRASDVLRERLSAFEGTLKGVSEETRAVLEKKDAMLRRLQGERKEEREASKRGVLYIPLIFIHRRMEIRRRCSGNMDHNQCTVTNS